jgi:hypothetical protein
MFCAIYTTGNKISESSVLNFLSDILKIPISHGRYIEDENFSISVDTNDEYNHEKEKDFPDGFLYFKLLIGIDFKETVDTEFASEVTGKILKYFWTSNYPAVASCTYEEMLIEKGGYNNTNVPWLLST